MIPQDFSPRVGQSPISQTAVNTVVSYMHLHHLNSKKAVMNGLAQMVDELGRKSAVFPQNPDQCLRIFEESVKQYFKSGDLSTYSNVTKHDSWLFLNALSSVQSRSPHLQSTERADQSDRSRVTTSYDSLQEARHSLAATQKGLVDIVNKQDYSTVDHLILGAGHMATTLWLEKHKNSHKTTQACLEQGKLPNTLMIGQTVGNWKHDYTLAQPHNLLEPGDQGRTAPKDFVTTKQYAKNYYVNARHLHQSDVRNLAATDAPLLLHTEVRGIEKREKHQEDWQSPEHPYRIKIVLHGGQEKTVYTKSVDFAGGLGVARDIFPGPYMSRASYEQLAAFDPKRGFTPLVDGNQFMLTSREEGGEPRQILVYGGGGSATACYRKAFFGHDRSGGQDPYTAENQKHQVAWFSRSGFEDAGAGTLAKSVVTHGKQERNLYCGELREVRFDPSTQKIKARFQLTKGTYEKVDIQGDLDKLNPVVEHRLHKGKLETVYTYEMECDQLVSSVGQDGSNLNGVLRELNQELVLNESTQEKVPLGIKTKDGRVQIWGAMATQVDWRMYAKKWDDSYTPKTRETIVSENISTDAEWPGVMPPSISQMRKDLSDRGEQLESVNASIDHVTVIEKYLKDVVGLSKREIDPFIRDILEKRRETASGMTKETLKSLIDKHGLRDKVKIRRHTFLAKA